MPERKATIKLIVDDRDVKRAEASVNRLQAAGRRSTGGGGVAQDLQKHAAEASKAARATNDMTRATESAAGATRRWGNALSTTTVAAGAFIGAFASQVIIGFTQKLFDGARALLQYKAGLEQTRIGFTSLLGSAAAAKTLLEEIKEFARTTPFEFQGLAQMAQRLAGANVEATKIIPLLRDIGNVVAATGAASQERLEGVTVAITQMISKQKVSAEEMEQLAERGVNGFNLLSEATGQTQAELRKMAEQGKLSSDVMVRALSQMSREKFGDAMAQQSKTFSGAMSNISDSIMEVASTAFEPLYKEISRFAVEYSQALETNRQGTADFGRDTAAILRGVIGMWSAATNAASQYLWVLNSGAIPASMKQAGAARTMFGSGALGEYLYRSGQGGTLAEPVAPRDYQLKPISKMPGISIPRMGGGGGGGGGRGSLKSEFQLGEKAKAIVEAAQRLGVSPLDLAIIISYESVGTFSPSKWGGTGGKYMGLIQFGPEERQRYGANPNQSFRDQLLNSAVPFLQDRSAKYGGTAGMDIVGLYKTINGGNPTVSINASDGNGKISEHIARMEATRGRVLKQMFGGSISNVPEMKDLDKWTKAFNEMQRNSILELFRKEEPIAGPDVTGAGVITGRRQAMTPDQIEEFVKIAPGLIRAIESDVAASGLSGAAADMEVIQRMIDAKKQALDLDGMAKEIGERNLWIAEATSRQEEYIGILSARRTTDMKERLKTAELELETQLRLFADPEYRKNAEDTAVLQEKIELNQQIFDLETAIATQGANAAERYRSAWLEAIYAVREANIQAAEDQIRAQVRIADQSTLHVEQVRARVLDHLAEQKSLSEALADGIISAFDKMLGRMNKALGAVGEIPIVGDLLKFAQQQALSKITTGLLDKFLPGLGGAFDKTKNPVAAPIVEKIKTTNDLLSQLVRLAGGNPIAGGVGGLLGGFGIGGPGGTAPWNPGGGFSPALGDGSTRPRIVGQNPTQGGGSILDLFSTKPGGIFAPRQNILTGTTSRMAGIAGGIGDLASIAGGMIGGRWGNAISLAGTGASIGSMFGPWGAAIGAAIGAGAGILMGIFGGDPKRKQDKKENLPKLQAGFTDAIKQLNEILAGVRSFTLDPESALSQATQVRNEIAGGFGINFLSKKYKKESRTLIAGKLTEADAIIAQIKQAAEISRGAADRRQRIVAEFAGGVFLDPAFRRRNGMLGGVFTGRDTLPSLLSPGEMVLNPMQQYRVRAAAGFDVFKGAGLPNYPDSAPSAALAGGGVAGRSLALADDRPIHVTIVMQGDVFDERAQRFQASDGGRRVIVDVVKDLRKTGDI